jgi:hypothetical protein
MEQTDKRNLLILLFVSLILSTFLFFQTYVISMDGAFQYVPMARLFVGGSLLDAINYSGQQPLYPSMIALVSPWVADLELAGRLISSFFGVLLVFPVYFLTRRVADERVALISAFLLIIHPYIRRFSADVLKESTYLFFLGMGLWFTLRAIQRDRIVLFIFVPILAVAAYLVRADGIEIILSVFVYVLFIEKAAQPRKKIKVIGTLLLCSGLLLLPYLAHLKGLTGVWTLSKTKSILGLLGLGQTTGDVPILSRMLYSLQELNWTIFRVNHPLYMLLFVIGLATKIRFGLRKGEGFLIIFLFVHYLVLYLMILNLTDWSGDKRGWFFFFSGRHVVPLLLVSTPWVGEGFLTVYRWTRKRAESIRLFHGSNPQRRLAALLPVLLVLVVAIILPKTLKPQRYERLPEKWAGSWIKAHSGTGVTILTTLPRVAYYAEGNYVSIDFQRDGVNQIQTSMLQSSPLYVVLRQREPTDYPEKFDSIKNNFSEVRRYSEREMERITVYKRVE